MSIESEIAAQFAGAVEVEHHLDEFSKQIADEIRDRTPEFGNLPPKRGEPGIGDPGDAKAAIQVSPIKSPGKRRVESDDPKAVWIELGAKHMPEYAPFAQVAALHGGTGPSILEDHGVQHAQKHLRERLEHVEKLAAEGAPPASIATAKLAVQRARMQRSAAFKAARSGRRGR